MGTGSWKPRVRLAGTVVLAVVILLALVAGGAVAMYSPERVRALAVESPSPTPTVPRPTPTTVPPVLATPATTAAPRAASVESRLAGLLGERSLGTRFGAYVVDPANERTLLSQRGTSAVTPASTAKIPTSVAALSALGPDTRFTTTAVRSGQSVVLVGGGDPTLLGPKRQPKLPAYPSLARLSTLAKETAKALGDNAGTVRVRIDDSLFSGPRTGPGWKPNYVPEGSVAPVSALTIDHGRSDPRKGGRVSDPAMLAGNAFRRLLANEGVRVAGKVGRAGAAKDAAELASVRSPTVAELVELTLTYSDNDVAEALARHVARAEGEPASFAGVARATGRVLAELGIGSGITLYDGSGLSTKDRVTPQGLAQVLQLVASGEHPDLSAVLSGMPVGGFSGTLADRYDQAESQGGVGVVRAKTGTLDGVSSLAGYVQDENGRVLVFAFVANGIPKKKAGETRPTLDRLSARLATCGCS
ncbi:MAG: D-alanyl-D-alanine carboxypeptidase/D-alanyl-D-alanine-endopeptidase [Streptosporangiales bacterium]|nr:D-alanyl-D-alanine carboxypeptidase/D-alanyl-D-alanine-endopeptidase [Streptosporangiales bacterium]